ncbi:ABC-2 family transporter protein [Candidatus Gottesmanbacteria bacterium]|nr:ABC-2 family transporter protein [Candidatus Gottesmanbacteria bacterium]
MHQIVRYSRIWWKFTTNSFMVSLAGRFNAGVFLVGKLLRFIFFFTFLLTIFSHTDSLGGYSAVQIAFFYFSYNFIDTLSQLLYREVYQFRPLIVSGDFDFVLVKPMNALFRSLFGSADPLDFFMLFPYTVILIYAAGLLGPLAAWDVIVYILLMISGFMIITGFHIVVLALGIIATEVDHAIMMFRDILSMGRIPVDIYREPLRGLLTFILPIGIMMTMPPKALMGLLSVWMIVVSLGLSLLFFVVCLKAWRYALSQYSSASS